MFKLPVDNYVTIDMNAFKTMLNVMGGITMYVPWDIIDKTTGELLVPQGTHQISGDTAEVILRNPGNYAQADYKRLETQQYFYAALVRTFLQEYDLADYYKACKNVAYYINTDLDLTEIYGLYATMTKVNPSDIYIVRLPGGGYDYTPAWFGQPVRLCAGSGCGGRPAERALPGGRPSSGGRQAGDSPPMGMAVRRDQRPRQDPGGREQRRRHRGDAGGVTAKPADLPKRAGEIQTIAIPPGTGPQLTRQKAACAAWCPFCAFSGRKRRFLADLHPQRPKPGWGSVRISEKTESTSGRKSRVCQWRTLIGQILRLKNSNERNQVKMYKK